MCFRSDRFTWAPGPLGEMMRESRRYEILRFTANLISALGWLLLVLGWVIPFLLLDAIGVLVGRFVGGDMSELSISANAVIVYFLIGLLNSLISFGIISYGQLLLLFVEIRDDLHEIARSY